MELALKIASWFVLGMIAGLILVKFATAALRRRINKPPPKGSRPNVRVIVDGVTYDLSESLIRGPDQDGKATWFFEGPQHVRLFGTLKTHIASPAPVDTRVQIMVVGNPKDGGRFMTMEEICRQFPDLP